MAPAAKASSHGIYGIIIAATSTAKMPKIGSTMPDMLPMAKARRVLIPSWRSGSDIAAPSGKFWMPMPMASARAEA
ncbi:hypothetical protein D3C81_1865580 [compost metagenome]